MSIDKLRNRLRSGLAIPAHPLALNRGRKLDERRQRALSRYYVEAGAGGLAVGVHTTQFGIRKVGLYSPVLELASETVRSSTAEHTVLIAGVIGDTKQAVAEAQTAVELGYHTGLLSLAALKDATDDELIQHCRAVAEVIPLFGFYLQPAVGGRRLSYDFWERFAQIERVVAVKIAPFDRAETINVGQAVAASGRNDIALYTGNDNDIVGDLVDPFPTGSDTGESHRFIDGGLLGQWAMWTKTSVELLARCKLARTHGDPALEALGRALTTANATIFDSANKFAGCIPGIHEVLRRQGFLEGTWCLDPHECLSPGQADEITRICEAYPFLTDDDFVANRIDGWMS